MTVLIGFMPRSTGLAKIKMVSGRKNVKPPPWIEPFSTLSWGGEVRSVSSGDSDSKYLAIDCPKPSDFGMVERDGFLEIDRTLVNSRVINEEIAVIRKDFERNGFFFDGQRLQPSTKPPIMQPSKPPIMQPSKSKPTMLPSKPLKENAPKKRQKKKLVLRKGLKHETQRKEFISSVSSFIYEQETKR